MCDAIRIARPQIASDAKKFLFTSDAKTLWVAVNLQEKCHKSSRENPAMLACNVENRHVFQHRAMRNACNSNSETRCGLTCDGSARDAKSLAMLVERCEPIGFPPLGFQEVNLITMTGLFVRNRAIQIENR